MDDTRLVMGEDARLVMGGDARLVMKNIHFPTDAQIGLGKVDRSTQTPIYNEVEPEADVVQVFMPRTRVHYAAALKKDLILAIELSWRHVQGIDARARSSISRDSWIENSLNLLSSMPPQMLDLVISGNLAGALWGEATPELRRFQDYMGPNNDWMLQSLKDAPVIYAVSLVSRDDGGAAPTVRELREVCRYLEDYASRKPSAVQVDNAFRSPSGGRSTLFDIREGRQRFFCRIENGERRPVRGRDSIVYTFVDALEKRLSKEADDNKQIMPPLQYIGYAFNYSKRQEQHSRGQTGFLMHLVNSICQVLWDGRYNLEPYPICYLARKEEAKCAEMLLSLMTNSFHQNGGGFNVAMLGDSNASVGMRQALHGEVEDFWEDKQAFRDSQPWTREANERIDAQEGEPLEDLHHPIEDQDRELMERLRALEERRDELLRALE